MTFFFETDEEPTPRQTVLVLLCLLGYYKRRNVSLVDAIITLLILNVCGVLGIHGPLQPFHLVCFSLVFIRFYINLYCFQ